MGVSTLVYVQDTGGTSFMLPLINSLPDRFRNEIKLTIMSHPLSTKLLLKELDSKLIFQEIEPVVEVEKWIQYLSKFKISKVFCTLSATSFDMSNANLIIASRKKNIPCLGFLDHWKGLSRLTDHNGVALYCPTWLGLIDYSSFSRIKHLNLSSIVSIVGHPILEKIENSTIRRKKTKKIVLISQPNDSNGSYESIFLSYYKGERLINVIKRIVETAGFKLFYRPHPKEKQSHDLFSTLAFDKSSKDQFFLNYDYYIGFDSLLLLEAFLRDGKCISLKLHEVYKSNSEEVPFSYALDVFSLNLIRDALVGKKDFPKRKKKFFGGSRKKCLEFIEKFLKESGDD